MKNNFYILLVAVATMGIFNACGSTQSASYAYDDIYYTPRAGTVIQAAPAYNEELTALKAKTSAAALTYGSDTLALGDDVVYLHADTNAMYITADPEKTYVIVDDNDSYERRLRMFDDPRYSITITYEYNDPWYYDSWYYPYNYYYSWYRPYYYGWSSWYWRPYYYDYWGWYYPGYSWGWHGWYGWHGHHHGHHWGGGYYAGNYTYGRSSG